jgi:uncharacterized protein
MSFGMIRAGGMIRAVVGCRTAAAAVIALAVVQGTPSARADAAAGSAAFDKGDYARAMAEWEGAAERGDPAAEFGLGMLYERGDGELKQDYKQADHWYEKAAEHGNSWAEFRLALIWSAGSDEFPADRVEAFKWSVLASEKGVAIDVKAQLGEALDRNQKAEAEKRAAAWKQAVAKKTEAAAAVVVAPAPTFAGAASSGAASSGAKSGGAAAPAVPPPRSAGAAPVAAAKSGGCPGWPFPTLPCTEQFPALPGAVGPRTLALPPPRPPGPN